MQRNLQVNNTENRNMKQKHLLKYLGGAAFVALLMWPLFRAGSGERNRETFEVSGWQAYRHLQLQEEDGQVHPERWQQAVEDKELMPINQESWREFWDHVQPPDIPAPPPKPWVTVGPGNIGGRITSLVIHPTDPNIMWAGGASGGIWKSVNGGISWTTNTDFLTNINISCMVADPMNPDIIYAGTGGETFPGNGIFRTRNGGTSWQPMESTHHNPDFIYVNRLAISPMDPQTILVGTYSGLMLTHDGGETWSHPTGISGDVSDVHFRPLDGTQCIASNRSGIAYYSDTGGESWGLAHWIVGPGLEPTGGLKLAYARSEPLIVYAQSQNKSGRLYRSSDGGRSFSMRHSCCTSALSYANCLWVDPTNSNTLLYGGGNLFRSTDGGLTGANQMYVNAPHQDHQIIVEDPGYTGSLGSNRTVYCGTDGGVYKTKDILRTATPPPPFGSSHVLWNTLNHDLGVTQFYAVTAYIPNGTIVGGTQDNGVLRYQSSSGDQNWHTIMIGDGGYCAADQTDPNYFYVSTQNLAISRSTDGGQSAPTVISLGIPANCGGSPCANFIAPVVIDPNNPNSLLAGGERLWRTVNARANNVTWSEIKGPTLPIPVYISTVAIAEGDSDTIWVGHNNGAVYYTTNGTSDNPTWTLVEGFPHRLCSRILIGPPRGGLPRKIYASFGGFSRGNVWKLDGDIWTDISSGLPALPVYALAASPFTPETLYIGTEMGVFASSDDGIIWSPSNGGPANVFVSDLFWMGRKLVAGTFGRGVFTLGPVDQ